MQSNYLTSIIRTIVPLVMGFIISYLARKGITLDEELNANLAMLIQLVVTALYYIVVRYLESKKSEFGWLLGSPTAPKYSKKTK